MVKVARLQSEFCTKDLFRATNFLRKMPPKFSPNFLSLCSVGRRKSPANFPLNFPNFPAKYQKKSPTSFCRSAGRRNGVSKQGYGNRAPIDDRNPIRKFSINEKTTPHRRYGHQLRTPFLRTPFQGLLNMISELVTFRTTKAKAKAKFGVNAKDHLSN